MRSDRSASTIVIVTFVVLVLELIIAAAIYLGTAALAWSVTAPDA